MISGIFLNERIVIVESLARTVPSRVLYYKGWCKDPITQL